MAKKKTAIPEKPAAKPRKSPTKRNKKTVVQNLAEEKFAAELIKTPEKPVVEIVQEMGVADPVVASHLANRWLDSKSVQQRINDALLMAGIEKDHAAGMLAKHLFVSQEDFHDEVGRFSFQRGVESGAMDAVEEFKIDHWGDIVGVKLPSKSRIVAVLAKINGWEKSPTPPPALDERMRSLALEILSDLQATGMDEPTARKYMRDKFPVLFRRL